MRALREVVALVYREVIWFKRFIGEFAFTWVFPLFFALAVIGLPATVSGFNTVLSRFSEVLGLEVSPGEALLVVIVSSSVLNVVATVMGDVLQTLYFEFRTEETINTVLLATTITRYAVATATVRPVIMAVFTTLYMLVAFVAFEGLAGFSTYSLTLIPLLLSSICLGFLSASVATVSYYYLGIKRPWAITGLLTPAILAGSGVFMPLKLVPWYLRLIAQATPVPYTTEALRLIVIAVPSFIEHFKLYAPVIAAFYAAYYALAFSATKVSERKVKSGW